MTTRHVGSQTFNFAYDAENRLVTVSGSASASFVYDGDGARVVSTMDGATTVFVGSHYEKVGTSVTKYYMAGASRVAMRKDGTLTYLLADHLGSSSISTDASGNRTSELRYKAWGETRFSFGSMPTKYTFTGQYAYMDDPSTPGSEGFGLMYYGARWYDPSLSRFAQADTTIPSTQGVQGWDRYAYTNNNPVLYTDPTGHFLCGGGWLAVACTAGLAGLARGVSNAGGYLLGAALSGKKVDLSVAGAHFAAGFITGAVKTALTPMPVAQTTTSETHSVETTSMEEVPGGFDVSHTYEGRDIVDTKYGGTTNCNIFGFNPCDASITIGIKANYVLTHNATPVTTTTTTTYDQFGNQYGTPSVSVSVGPTLVETQQNCASTDPNSCGLPYVPSYLEDDSGE